MGRAGSSSASSLVGGGRIVVLPASAACVQAYVQALSCRTRFS